MLYKTMNDWAGYCKKYYSRVNSEDSEDDESRGEAPLSLEKIGSESRGEALHSLEKIGSESKGEALHSPKKTGSESKGEALHSPKKTDADINSVENSGTIGFDTDRNDEKKIAGANNIKPAHIPPLVSYITFNRLGLTVKNLTQILNSDEDFEMHIIDSNSKDDTWDYIQSLTDPRIKSKVRLKANIGPIYAVNMALAKRKPGQYFFTVDSDVFIKTPNWISKFMEVFDAFPDVGVLGLMRDNPYPRYLPPIIPRINGDTSFLQLKNAKIDTIMDFIPGHLQCLRPELVDLIGFWSEENGYGDAELSPRVVHYTPYTVGFLTNIDIDMNQFIACGDCPAKPWCKLDGVSRNCFVLGVSHNKNDSFANKFHWKYIETFKELAKGKRTAFCGSIHKPETMEKYYYNREWAYENFDFYIDNSN